MNALYVSPRDCWPANTGARLRDFHLARQIARRTNLTYIGFTADCTTPVTRGRLKSLQDSEYILVSRTRGYGPASLVLGLLGPLPLTVRNYARPAMSAELTRVLSATRFDVVQIEGVHLFAYVGQIRALCPDARLVCDWHNIESELVERFAANTTNSLKRWYARRTATLLRNCEKKLLAACDAHSVCSERERELLQGVDPQARIHVVPNGVDVEFYAADATPVPRTNIVFVGSMDYHANIDAALYFAQEVWPAIHERRPELQFVIVGSRPVPEIVSLGTRPGITVTGTVDDIRPYYTSALAVVVPLRVGSGTRLKVLEAMAAAVPVVSTTLGVEGLAVQDRKNVLIGDSADAMTSAICGLDANSPLWQRIASEGRALVKAHYDWSNIGANLAQLYNELPGVARR